MKSCTVFKTAEQLYVICQYQTDSGFLLSSLPVFKLDLGCDDIIFGEAVLNALEQSDSIVATPARDEYPILERTVMELIGERSYTQLYKNSGSCEIRIENGDMMIRPNKFFNPKKPADGLVWVDAQDHRIAAIEIKPERIAILIRSILNSYPSHN